MRFVKNVQRNATGWKGLVLVFSLLAATPAFPETFEITKDSCKAPGDTAVVYQAGSGTTIATCENVLALKDTARIPGVLELSPQTFSLQDHIAAGRGFETRLGDDAAFLVVNLTVHNLSERNLTLSPNQFILIDPETGTFTNPGTLALQNDPLVTPGAMGLLAIVRPDETRSFNVVLPCFKAWASKASVRLGFLYDIDPLSVFMPKMPAVSWDLFR